MVEREAATVEPGADGEFATYDEWARLGPLPPFRSAVFIDAQRRRCLTHRDFLRAREEDAFLVRYYYYWETSAGAKKPPPR